MYHWVILTRNPSYRMKTDMDRDVYYFKNEFNTVKLFDALCISTKNISGKVSPR